MKAPLKAILIDHDDSFTFNLQHWLHAFCDQVQIVNHLEINDQQFTEFDFVVLSPGPKSPHDYPHMIQWLQKKFFTKSIFGVCLGMQLLAIAGGGKVEPYLQPLHGKKSKLETNIPEFNNLVVARYHSLECLDLKDFDLIARCGTTAMWIEHANEKWLGVQFHPESFMTEKPFLLQNYLQQWICK